MGQQVTRTAPCHIRISRHHIVCPGMNGVNVLLLDSIALRSATNAGQHIHVNISRREALILALRTVVIRKCQCVERELTRTFRYNRVIVGHAALMPRGGEFDFFTRGYIIHIHLRRSVHSRGEHEFQVSVSRNLQLIMCRRACRNA